MNVLSPNQTLQATAVKRLGWQVGCQRPAVPELIRSTTSYMKTISLAVVVVILGITQSIAMPLRDAFIRKPGQYSLDDSGSTLAITNSMAGRYAIFARWRSGSVPLSVSSPDYLRAEGWFVFVEQPNRIWVFDGIDNCHLLTASDRTVSVDSLSGGLKEPLPRKVWDAFPEAVRTKYRKVEPSAPGNSR